MSAARKVAYDPARSAADWNPAAEPADPRDWNPRGRRNGPPERPAGEEVLMFGLAPRPGRGHTLMFTPAAIPSHTIRTART